MTVSCQGIQNIKHEILVRFLIIGFLSQTRDKLLKKPTDLWLGTTFLGKIPNERAQSGRWLGGVQGSRNSFFGFHRSLRLSAVHSPKRPCLGQSTLKFLERHGIFWFYHAMSCFVLTESKVRYQLIHFNIPYRVEPYSAKANRPAVPSQLGGIVGGNRHASLAGMYHVRWFSRQNIGSRLGGWPHAKQTRAWASGRPAIRIFFHASEEAHPFQDIN